MLPFFENKQEQVTLSCPESMNFPAHLHHHVELLYVTHGSLEVLVGAQWQTVREGGLAVVFPGKVHAYHTPEHCRSVMLIAPLSFCGPLKGIYRDNQPDCPFLAPGGVPPALTQNLTELLHTTDEAVLQGLVHLILARVLTLVTLTPRTAYDKDTLLYSAISLLSRSYRDNVQLRTLTTQLGVSECHLSRVLTSGTGVGFREYVNSLRIADAQHLLLTTELSVLEIAMECGFQTLRTFNRAFLSAAQCTPKAYRKRFSRAGQTDR